KTFIYIANELLLNNKNTIQSLLCKQIEWYGSVYGFFKIYVADLQGSFLIHLENNNIFCFCYVVIIFSFYIVFSVISEHTNLYIDFVFFFCFFILYVVVLLGSFLIHLDNNNLFFFCYVVIIFSFHIVFSEKAEHTSRLNNICKCFWVFFINNIF